MVVVGAATVATYRVGMEVLAPPLAFLLTVGYVAALAGAFALIRKRVDRLEGSRSGKWSGGVIRRERRFVTGRLIAGKQEDEWIAGGLASAYQFSISDVLAGDVPVSELKGSQPLPRLGPKYRNAEVPVQRLHLGTLTSHRANTNKLPIGTTAPGYYKKSLKCGVSPFVVGYRAAIQIRSRK